MGKVPIAAATEMNIKKKKGRPSKNPLPLSTPPKPPTSSPTNRRSTRRNPNHFNSPPQTEFGDDDDDERQEKKVKLVVRLPQSDEKIKVAEKHQQQNRRHSREFDLGSGSGSKSESDGESDDQQGCAKKRKINDVNHGSDDGVSDQDKDVLKGTDTFLHGSQLESGPTTPLPDQKVLLFILDRLQKKDTYGVFSEPVDPNELPDYFDMIEQPMDFGTVRKKLDNGDYKNLEELEADVLLICSNAMQYNSADTVYHRQARTIQDLAKRDFNNLKHEGDDGELQPKVIRRGRPPNSKNQRKPLQTSPVVDRVGNELSSGATLAEEEDKATGSNSYNLRKGSALYRFRSTDPFVSSNGSRNGENHSEWSADWNNEFPASILRADMKYGKKQFTVDENRRDTYRQFHPLSLCSNSLVLSDSVGNMKRLMPVGLQEVLSYPRSLSRYAANLGPVAWIIASKKIEAVLPAGVQYGPGWVGHRESPLQTLSFSMENQKSSNSTAGNCNSGKLPTPSAAAVSQQNHNTNGISGTFSCNDLSAKSGDSVTEGSSVPCMKVKTEHGNDLSSSHSPSMNHVFPGQVKLESRNSLPPPPGHDLGKADTKHGEVEESILSKSSQQESLLLLQQRHTNNDNSNNNNNRSGAPDLNVRVAAGSSGSSLRTGSPPQQPDLALQL
ncbi:hypothetical protein OROHE_001820 [Orobanche hederae]